MAKKKHIQPYAARILAVAILAVALPLMGSCAATGYQVGVGASFGYGSDDVQFLAAYGDWVTVSPFGEVWVPSVAPGWQPFFYGHWVWTDDGWAWVSYEPYGWLVYHYGY